MIFNAPALRCRAARPVHVCAWNLLPGGNKLLFPPLTIIAAGSRVQKNFSGVEYINTTKLGLTSRLQLAELRASLQMIVEFCPESVCQADECPLFAVRQMPPEERATWFDHLSEEDLTYLAAYHHVYWGLKMGPETVAGIVPSQSDASHLAVG
jgi:hypothetical protein